MASMTKAQLVDENIRLRAECARLESELASAKTSIAPRSIVRAPRQLPAHFAAAREMAIRLGRCVKVDA